MNDCEFAAYLAGFTDGEGYIGVQKDKRNGSRSVNIILANTVHSVLKMIQSRLGFGYISSQKLRENWAVRYTLQIRNLSDCLSFINLVRPHLHIKAKAADSALAHIATRMKFWSEKDARNSEIRKRANAGEVRSRIAKDFGVSPQLVSNICEGHKWPSTLKEFAGRRKRDHRGLFVKADTIR